MQASHSFEAVRSHERFRLTARAAELYLGDTHIQLLVEDTEAGSAIRLGRAELLPLLHAIKEVIKAVDDAAASLPTDPVERAARRVPWSGKYHGMKRGHILKSYAQELDELRERYVIRFDEWADQIKNPPPYTPPRPPVPEGGWDPNS